MGSEESYGETWDNVEMEDETQPIRLMAGDCSELFEKYLSHPSSSAKYTLPSTVSSEVIRFLQELKDRFDAWSSFLGVFAATNACLDYRLRRHPALQDMIIRLLDVLRRNIYLVGVYMMPETPQVDNSGDHVMRDAPALSDLETSFSGIEESITRLNKLGIAIRSSSRSTTTARARRFASQNPQLTRLRKFEEIAYLALQSLYPNASESLRQQLVAAMTDRYTKLQYESYRRRNDLTHSQQSAEARSPSNRDQNTKEGGRVDQTMESSSEQYSTTHPLKPPDIRIGIPASSIDTTLLHANLEKAAPTAPETRSAKTMTIHTTRLREPPVPNFEGGKEYVSCQWCFQDIDRSFIRVSQDGHIEWSNKGRGHYRSDLQPYVCIAEGCCESRPTYSSSRDWSNHMISAHTEYWSQDLHSRMLWACTTSHDNDSLYLFSTQDEIYNHMVLQHKCSMVSTQDQEIENVSCLVSQIGAEIQRPPSCCPLCLFSLEGGSASGDKPDDTVGAMKSSHKDKRQLESSNRPNEPVEYTSDSAGVDRTITSWEMGSHIAEHLHYLMILSLQLISAMNGSSYGEGDKQSEPSSPNSSMSLLSDGQLKARLDDLPGELQRRMSWSDVSETAMYINHDLMIIPDDANYVENEHGGDSSWDIIKPALAEARASRQAVEPVKQLRNHKDYTIGWICPLATDYVAAKAFLDEEHEGPEHSNLSSNDNNSYTLGRVGQHNVVICPIPQYYQISTTSPASRVAREMLFSFPNIRTDLVVSISGGAPSQKHDIRLGDVVVSVSRDGKSGVLQYDFGKTTQNRSFQQTDALNQAPEFLLAAVNGLAARYSIDGNRYAEDTKKILQGKPRLQNKFGRPDPSSDRLYRSDIVHPADKSSCEVACGTDLSKLVPRSARGQHDDNPAIHYGVIACGNQMMKDASVRDRLAAEQDILCFEMGATGVMDDFPGLVIRGICDYSDSHKNKEWQGYASMVAAAYAKDLLCHIDPGSIGAEDETLSVSVGSVTNLAELSANLELGPGIKEEVELNLEHPGREIISRGDLQRLRARTRCLVSTHVILFDHYLVLAKPLPTQEPSQTTKCLQYYVSKQPVPMDLLVLDSTNDDPVAESSIRDIASDAPAHAATGLNHGGPRDTTEGPTAFLEEVQWPFKIKHLGRSGTTYILYASSAESRADWCEKIIEAKTRHAAALFSLNAEPFRLRVLADTAFAYSDEATCSESAAVITGTPLHRAIKEVEKQYGNSGPRPPPICRAAANCSTVFQRPPGRTLCIIGTHFGAYMSDVNHPRGWYLIFPKMLVTQVAVFEELNLLLFLADRSLFAYHLDLIVPGSENKIQSLDRAREAPLKLSGNRDVGFFVAGRLKGRNLVLYKKRDGLSSTFKVLEPITQKPSSRKDPPGRLFLLQRSKSKLFREFDEFYIPAESYGINIFHSSLAISTQRGIEVLTLDRKQSWSVPDLHSETPDRSDTLDNIANRIKDLRPLGMYRISEMEFIIAYTECAVYVNKHGDVSRSEIMEFVGTAHTACLYRRFLILFNDDFVEIRDVTNGRLKQVIPGHGVDCLDDGSRLPGSFGQANAGGINTQTNFNRKNGASTNQHSVKICMQHPYYARSQIMLELVENDGQEI